MGLFCGVEVVQKFVVKQRKEKKKKSDTVVPTFVANFPKKGEQGPRKKGGITRRERVARGAGCVVCIMVA